MSSSPIARRGATTALTVLAAAVLLLVGFAHGSASAAEPTKGSVVITIPSGKAGKVSAITPAKVTKRIGKKGAKVSAAAKNGSFGEKVATGLQAAGALKLTNGKRSVKITGLKLAIDKKLTVIRGNVAGAKNVVVFTAAGSGTFSADPASVRFTGGKLTFPGSVAKKLKNRLGLKKAPTGRLGTLYVNAYKDKTTPVDPCEADPFGEGCPITDPYLAQCNVAATSREVGSLPAPAALPTLTGAQSITGLDTVSWGIKSSFRNYIVTAASGSIHALDGATTVGDAAPYTSFNWTFVDGQYADNGTPNDSSDDQAVLNLNGTVVLCATGHNFRVAVSDPTVVIDGANSRIIADVDANLDGKWVPTQRVDLATLNLGGGTNEPLSLTQGAKWDNVPATLTLTGGKAICGDGQPLCPYTAGTVMDPISVQAPAGTLTDQYNAQCGVPAASRDINSWTDASALPTLTNPADVTAAGSLTWGFKSSFRAYVNGVMYNAGKVLDAQQALDGASETNDSPGPPPPSNNLFSFPISGGEYLENDEVDTADDQAVVNGTGTALICNSVHSFWVSISNPTVVIDGANSRIVATISENINGGGMFGPVGAWETPQRVDLADLDLSGVTPTYGTGTVTWSAVPATLSESASPFATYPQGPGPVALDPITVTVSTD